MMVFLSQLKIHLKHREPAGKILSNKMKYIKKTTTRHSEFAQHKEITKTWGFRYFFWFAITHRTSKVLCKWRRNRSSLCSTNDVNLEQGVWPTKPLTSLLTWDFCYIGLGNNELWRPEGEKTTSLMVLLSHPRDLCNTMLRETTMGMVGIQWVSQVKGSGVEWDSRYISRKGLISFSSYLHTYLYTILLRSDTLTSSPLLVWSYSWMRFLIVNQVNIARVTEKSYGRLTGSWMGNRPWVSCNCGGSKPWGRSGHTALESSRKEATHLLRKVSGRKRGVRGRVSSLFINYF